KYGKRDNILITRETTDGITTQRVDLTSTDFMQSDYFYLKQNDIVYVEPNNTRVNSSGVGPNISIYLTVISLLLTTTALILSNTNKQKIKIKKSAAAFFFTFMALDIHTNQSDILKKLERCPRQ